MVVGGRDRDPVAPTNSAVVGATGRSDSKRPHRAVLRNRPGSSRGNRRKVAYPHAVATGDHYQVGRRRVGAATRRHPVVRPAVSARRGGKTRRADTHPGRAAVVGGPGWPTHRSPPAHPLRAQWQRRFCRQAGLTRRYHDTRLWARERRNSRFDAGHLGDDLGALLADHTVYPRLVFIEACRWSPTAVHAAGDSWIHPSWTTKIDVMASDLPLAIQLPNRADDRTTMSDVRSCHRAGVGGRTVGMAPLFSRAREWDREVKSSAARRAGEASSGHLARPNARRSDRRRSGTWRRTPGCNHRGQPRCP